MKIAFFCIPAQGHTNPTLPVVRELVSRGHQVRYYSYDALKDKIEAAGATYVSCDPYDIQMKLKPEDVQRLVTDVAFSMEVVVNTTLAMDEAIYDQMEDWKPDCIVGDSVAFWGKLTAMKLHVPFVSSTTTFAFNRESAKIMKQSKRSALRSFFSMFKAQKSIQKLRAKGYPVKNVLSIIANDNQTDTIVYTSRGFQPCADSFSDKYTFVGPSVPAADDSIKRTKRPSVYISLGTVLNDQAAFYKSCIEAFRNQDMDVILSVGDTVDPARLGEIPDNFTIEHRVNQIQVLQQVHVFLTHCGMNSVNEALYYGVPLVLYPQTAEQSGVAARVNELGAGTYLKDDTKQSIRDTVNQVLHTEAYRQQAEQISRDFQKCKGAPLAADKILAAAGQKN